MDDINDKIKYKGYRLERESKSVRMTLLIRPTTKDALEKLKEKTGISMNEIINEIIESHVFSR